MNRVIGILVLPIVGLLGACAQSQAGKVVPANAETVVLSLREISCQSCGAASVRALEQRDDVYAAAFDRDSVELTVSHDPTQITPEGLATVIEGLGYQAEVGAGHGAYAADVEFPQDVDVQWISKTGEAVDIEAHRVAGKVTVFDFYATWCGPCREVDREMLSILMEDSEVALRKLNVVDWETPVVERYLKNVPNLPYVIVYSQTGERVAAIAGLHLDKLRNAIKRGKL